MSGVTSAKMQSENSQLSSDEKPSLKNILRNKSFMLVLGGQLTNMLASVLVGMTFSYLIFDVTKNAALMALMGIVGALPTILFVLFAGVIIDRFDQRKIMLFSMILRMLVFIIFLLCFIFRNYLIQDYFIPTTNVHGDTIIIHSINYNHFIWPLYAALFISNLGFTMYSVSAGTYTKYIIEKKDYLVVNSLNSTTTQISMVVSPILAGAIITISYFYSFLVGVCIITLAVIFCSLVVLKGMKTPQVNTEKSSGFKNQMKKVFIDIRVGMIAIKSEPKILYITVVYVLFNFVTNARYSMYNVILQGELNLSANWIGIITAVTGAISVIASIVIMKIGKIKRKLLLVNLVVALDAIGMILFSFNRNVWIMLFVIVIPFGLVSGIANIPTQTLRQEKIPHEKLGRLFSSVLLFISIANLVSSLIIIFISNIVEPMYIVFGGGILCALLFIVSFIIYLSKESLRCSDYKDEEMKDVKGIEIP